jgi:predicted transcriptional regulator
MDKDSILKLMSFLSNDLDRSILKSLLRGPKDIRALCRDINRKRSTVFDNLKEMEETGVIQSNKVKTPGRGRNKKEYTLKEFYIPEITKGTLLDFLEGKDVKAKSLDFGDMALIGGFSQMFPVPPEKIFDLLLSSGVDFKYILQIILDLVSEYQDGAEEPKAGSKLEEHNKPMTALYKRIVEIMRSRYPIRDEVIEKFIEISKDEIVLTSQSGPKRISTKGLVSIATRELGILEYEAEFIAPAVLHMLKSHEFSEISYAIIVDLLYLMAKNMNIDCRKPKFYIESSVVREFKEYQNIEVRDGSVIRKWGALHIADFLSRRLELNQNSSKFLASVIFQRLKYINLESYDISFIESLARELIREHRI